MIVNVGTAVLGGRNLSYTPSQWRWRHQSAVLQGMSFTIFFCLFYLSEVSCTRIFSWFGSECSGLCPLKRSPGYQGTMVISQTGPSSNEDSMRWMQRRCEPSSGRKLSQQNSGSCRRSLSCAMIKSHVGGRIPAFNHAKVAPFRGELCTNGFSLYSTILCRNRHGKFSGGNIRQSFVGTNYRWRYLFTHDSAVLSAPARLSSVPVTARALKHK